MKVRFHTNLDEAQSFVFHQLAYGEPHFSVVPRVGERIRFDLSEHGERLRGHFFDLEVCGVTYLANGEDVLVELHMPRIPALSVSEWSDRLKKRLCGY